MATSLERKDGAGDHKRRAASTTTTGRILVVDDDEDLRDLLVLALGQDGWHIDQAADAQQALAHLRRGGFNLVITDYDLPGRTGGQMLAEAARERLLSNCAVLVVTGHPNPGDVGESPVITKPFDLDVLRRQVRRILETAETAASPATVPPAAKPKAPATAPAAAPAAGVELVLYVARPSTASRLAERNLRRILEGLPGGAARLTVRDVADHPKEAERDRILFAPTLVVRCATPMWVVGNLRNPAALIGILDLCGPDGRYA